MATMGDQTMAKAPIQVIIDNQVLTLDQPPAVEDGRILLPLRGIFEALGARVDWDSSAQTVTGTKDNVVLKLEIGKRQARVNGKRVLMDVPGKVIRGTTMVPIRFVAEHLGLEVAWEDQAQKLIMATTPITQGPSLDQLTRDVLIYRNSYLPDDYVEIRMQGDHALLIQGRTLSPNQYILVEILDGSGETFFTKQSRMREDKHFNETYYLNFKEGSYQLNIYMNESQYGRYQGVHTDIILHKFKAGMEFEPSPIYENNLSYIDKSNKVSLSDLSLANFSKAHKGRLMALAVSISQDKDTDYYKALAIAQWVSANIYYDLDVLETGIFGKTDAIGTLDEKRSICQGYAALTSGLLRSIKIPSRLVYGYALDGELQPGNWESADHTEPNHVWNEVFIDGKWIIVDTTWNSKNRYSEGEYTKKSPVYSYFDPTLEALSITHKITNR